MLLDDYLDAAAQAPWQWGVMDCVHFGGGWVRAATRQDPCAPWRGSYTTAAGAKRVILKAGGFSALVDDAMSRCGFVRANSLEHGDIAVLKIPAGQGGYDVAGAAVVISCSGWLLARGLDGIFGLRGEPVAAWRVLR